MQSLQTSGVQSHVQMSSVVVVFIPTEQKPKETGGQDQLIKQVELGLTPALKPKPMLAFCT